MSFAVDVGVGGLLVGVVETGGGAGDGTADGSDLICFTMSSVSSCLVRGETDRFRDPGMTVLSSICTLKFLDRAARAVERA